MYACLYVSCKYSRRSISHSVRPTALPHPAQHNRDPQRPKHQRPDAPPPARAVRPRRPRRAPVGPRGVHLEDERLALGAPRAARADVVRVHDGREPHVRVEVREGARVRACAVGGWGRGGGRGGGGGGGGGQRRARALGGGQVRVRAGEEREAVDGAREERGGRRVGEGRVVVGVVEEEAVGLLARVSTHLSWDKRGGGGVPGVRTSRPGSRAPSSRGPPARS